MYPCNSKCISLTSQSYVTVRKHAIHVVNSISSLLYLVFNNNAVTKILK